MKISYNWLKDYIETNLEPEELGEILTNTGLETESIETFESLPGGLEGIVIGEVVSAKKHPNADKLTLTEVDIGNNTVVSIVCGAPNVKTGQKVPVATIGTTLHTEDGESFTIKKTKIRGEVSEGMICAENELALGDSHEGIMVLDKNAVPGTSGSEYFHIFRDTVLEIGLTPNRIDGASHYGVARDLAAYLNQSQPKKARLPDISNFKVDNSDRVIPVVVENPEACPRYTGLTVSGLKVKPSPDWMQARLKAIGLSPINNIVDITNYVLFETGQPLHAFDADKIDGNKVVVKTLKEGTPFITLDGEKRTLSNKDLMICSAASGMCIGGVFGGNDSGVTGETTAIFLESAHFNPVFIRRSSKKHGLITDASFRFERGADPEMTLYALKRAAILIKKFAGGAITSPIQDSYPVPFKPAVVELTYNNLNRLAGQTIPAGSAKSILKSLDFKILEENKEGIQVEVPLYRVDVTREADVIEEILRIYGYNRIEVGSSTHMSLNHFDKPDKSRVINQVSDLLCANGFSEIMANSLSRAAYYEGNPVFPKKKSVQLYNPLSQDLNTMRQTLLYGGLEALIHNINRKRSNLKFFEFGTVYSRKSETKHNLEQFVEHPKLGLLVTGMNTGEHWQTKPAQTDFYFLKGVIDLILKRAGLGDSGIHIAGTKAGYFSKGLTYRYNNKELLQIGSLSKHTLAPFEIEQDVQFAEISFDVLLIAFKSIKINLQEIPKYPEVRRDLALLIDSGIKFEQIRELAYKTEGKLLKKINLFDVFTSEKLGRGKKSYAVSFTLQDPQKTLTDKQIDKIMQRLIDAYIKNLGAQIR